MDLFLLFENCEKSISMPIFRIRFLNIDHCVRMAAEADLAKSFWQNERCPLLSQTKNVTKGFPIESKPSP